MRKHKIKAIISTILMLTFALAFITGLVLHCNKGGMVLGLPRAYWSSAHMLAAMLMSAGICLHLPLNWALYRRELGLRRREAAVGRDIEQTDEAEKQ